MPLKYLGGVLKTGQNIGFVYKKCILCKDADNGLKHVVNECVKLKNDKKWKKTIINRIK